MAQTKRKRKTKHRGNAAGKVEARGRTSKAGGGGSTRRPSGGKGKERVSRLDQEPTWKGATWRAAITAPLLLLAIVFVFGKPMEYAIPVSMMMFLVYIPTGYYFDQFMYNRRMGKRGG